MGIEVITFVFGGVLLLTGILGGGFEVREFKIPKVSWLPRLLASLLGVFFVMLGFGIGIAKLTPSENEHNKSGTAFVMQNPTPNGLAVPHDQNAARPSPINFTVYDELGEGQVSEQVTVLINGRLVGTLTVNSHYPSSMITITVPEAGRYSYTVEGHAVFENDEEQFEHTGVGQGIIDVEAGKRFDLAASYSGSNWTITLMEGAQ